MDNFSIVFQITQNCQFNCGVCNRRFETGERILPQDKIEYIIDTLHHLGLKRLCITGGEPMLHPDKCLEIFSYARSKGIHTALSTTGINLDTFLYEFDKVLDHLLISIPTFNRLKWNNYFGIKNDDFKLYHDVMNLLGLLQNTGVILEVNTVLSQFNHEKIIDIGERLFQINPLAIWRIEDYYANGIHADFEQQFILDQNVSNLAKDKVISKFGQDYTLYISDGKREYAPDVFITPSGNLVTTGDHEYKSINKSIFDPKFIHDFKMRREWAEYQKYCRNW